MLNVVVLVSGGGTNLQALIDAVENGTVTNTKIAAVISNKPGAFALTRAANAGIPGECISPKDYRRPAGDAANAGGTACDENAPRFASFADAMLDAFKRYETDLIVLAGYLVIVPEKIIKAYAGKIINIHPSLIPSHCGDGFYGLHVHESVLARGNKVTGATVHFVDEGTDTGPIILQKAVEVKEGDTSEILQKRVMEEAEWVILPKAVDLIANGKVKLEGNLAHIVE